MSCAGSPAASWRARRAGRPLGATTLLHEAYLDIAQREGPRFPDRARFMAYAARVMRGLIIDRARAVRPRSAAAASRSPRSTARTGRRGRRPTPRRSRASALHSTELGARRAGARGARRPQVLLRLRVRRDREHARDLASARCSGTGTRRGIYLHRRIRDGAGRPRDDRLTASAGALVSPQLDRGARALDAESGGVARELCGRTIPRSPHDLEVLLAERNGPSRDEGFLEARRAGCLAAAPLAGPGVRRLHAGLADRRRAAWGASGWRAATTGASRGRPRSSCSTPRSSAAAGDDRFRREGTILARLDAPAHRPADRRRRLRRRASPTWSSSTSRGSRSTAAATSRGLDVEARVRLFLDVLAAVAHAHAQPGRPSRHEAVERHGVERRPGEAARLRHRQAARGRGRAGDGAPTADARGGARLHAGVRRARADHRRARDHRHRRLRPGRPALSPADRTPSAGDRRASSADRLRAILETEPGRLSDGIAAAGGGAARQHPRAPAAQLRGDLDTIVAKALKKRPEERYASVTALAEDVRRYLARGADPRPPRLPGLPGPEVRAPQRARPGGRGRRRVLALAAVVAFYGTQLAGERDRGAPARRGRRPR